MRSLCAGRQRLIVIPAFGPSVISALCVCRTMLTLLASCNGRSSYQGGHGAHGRLAPGTLEGWQDTSGEPGAGWLGDSGGLTEKECDCRDRCFPLTTQAEDLGLVLGALELLLLDAWRVVSFCNPFQPVPLILGVLPRIEVDKGEDSDKYLVLCCLLSCNLVPSRGRGFPTVVDVRERAGRGVWRVTARSR